MPKTNDFAPSRCFYLFNVDLIQVCNNILEVSFKVSKTDSFIGKGSRTLSCLKLTDYEEFDHTKDARNLGKQVIGIQEKIIYKNAAQLTFQSIAG